VQITPDEIIYWEYGRHNQCNNCFYVGFNGSYGWGFFSDNPEN